MSEIIIVFQSLSNFLFLRELLYARVIIALPERAPGARKQLIQSGLAFALSCKQRFASQMGMMLKVRFGALPRHAQEVRLAKRLALPGRSS